MVVVVVACSRGSNIRGRSGRSNSGNSSILVVYPLFNLSAKDVDVNSSFTVYLVRIYKVYGKVPKYNDE